MRKLSPERKAVVKAELRLRVIFTNRAMCRRHGISLRTLVSLESETLDPFAEGVGRARLKLIAQIAQDTPPQLCLTPANTAKVEKS